MSHVCMDIWRVTIRVRRTFHLDFLDSPVLLKFDSVKKAHQMSTHKKSSFIWFILHNHRIVRYSGNFRAYARGVNQLGRARSIEQQCSIHPHAYKICNSNQTGTYGMRQKLFYHLIRWTVTRWHYWAKDNFHRFSFSVWFCFFFSSILFIKFTIQIVKFAYQSLYLFESH